MRLTMNETKPKSQSKTLWANGLALVAMLLTAASQYQLVLDNPVAVGLVAIAITIVNMGLRFVTSKKLS